MSGNKKALVYIVERANGGNLGRDIVFQASRAHPQLEVRRMDWMLAHSSIYRLRGSPSPSVVVVPLINDKPDW